MSGVVGQLEDSMRVDPGHIQYVAENLKRPFLTARLGEHLLIYSEHGSGMVHVGSEVIGDEFMPHFPYQTKLSSCLLVDRVVLSSIK